MNIRDTLLNGNPLADHFQCYNENRNGYISLAVETRSNKVLAKAVKSLVWAHVLVVILQNKDREAFQRLSPHIELLEISKACEILDTPRLIKQLEYKLAKKYNNTLANKLRRLKSDVLEGLSLTQSKIKMVRSWVKSLSGKELIFQALMYPKEPWTLLADLCHLNPRNDFAIDWFLPYCFGEPAPKDSVIWKLENAVDVSSICKEYQLSYELARATILTKIPNRRELLKWFAETESLETLLWYYSEFIEFAPTIVKRLKETQELKLSYGKLVSLLMTTRGELYEQLLKLAEKRVQDYKMNLESPVVVLGDASSSMQVAINTSSIIASLLCTLAEAELRLFKNVDIPVENPPRTVSDAVKFAREMVATNCTSPASSLYAYYKLKKPVKTFIIVTDEEENTDYTGQNHWYGGSDNEKMFAKLYDQYCAEVGPAKLVFISFTRPNSDGQMVAALKKIIGEKKAAEFIDVYKFDAQNPDLNKLDYILEKLAKPKESKGWFSGWVYV